MILDGNSRVGEAKVYATQKEMNQKKEILHLKDFIRESVTCMKSICDLKGCDFDDVHEYLNKVKDI